MEKCLTTHRSRAVSAIAAVVVLVGVGISSAAGPRAAAAGGLDEQVFERFKARRAGDRASAAQHAITVAGVERRYNLFMPDAGARHSARPLVVALHGMGGDATRLQNHFGLDAVAQREGFIVAYPEAVAGIWSDTLGDEPNRRRGAAIGNDTAFIEALVDRLITGGLADAGRVYVTGISMGGFMALRLACDGNDRFAAFAPLIASTAARDRTECRLAAPKPFLMINGTEDRLVAWDGRSGYRKGPDGRGVLPVPDTAAMLARLNHCTASREIALADVDPTDGTVVIETRYQQCHGNAVVRHLVVKGGGHTLPTLAPRSTRWMLGRGNRDLDTAETVWRFFATSG
jgi:polyhydroxybutyrate depolymerase